MEVLFSVVCIVSIMLLWFIIVMLVAKKTVGKDAKTWEIFTFLFVADPVGWAVLLIIAVMELIDIAFSNLFKGK